MPTNSITKDFYCNPETLNKLINDLDNYKSLKKKHDKNKVSSLEYGREKLRELSCPK